MAATTQTDEFISITCENDKEFKMKRSLLARMRSIYITEHLGRLIGLKLTVIKLNSLTKIVQWLEHYPTCPQRVNGELIFTEWDRAFFEDVNGESFMHLRCAAKLLDVDGLYEYVMKFLESKFKALPLAEMVAINLLHDLEGNDTLIKIADYLLK